MPQPYLWWTLCCLSSQQTNPPVISTHQKPHRFGVDSKRLRFVVEISSFSGASRLTEILTQVGGQDVPYWYWDEMLRGLGYSELQNAGHKGWVDWLKVLTHFCKNGMVLHVFFCLDVYNYFWMMSPSIFFHKCWWSTCWVQKTWQFGWMSWMMTEREACASHRISEKNYQHLLNIHRNIY